MNLLRPFSCVVVVRSAFSLLSCFIAILPAHAADQTRPVADAMVNQVAFDQNLGAQVPLDSPFKDDQGKDTSLGKILTRSKHPTVLVLGYHECPMLCSLVLGGLVESFNDLRMTAGVQFDLIDLSIKPGESVELAAKQKRIYLKRYGRGAAAGVGWHFLTGPEASIRQVADAVGFHYAYDPVARQYAHASGIVVLTPDGRVSRYFYGVNYEARALNAALVTAGAHQISSPVEKLLLLCFHYNPINGKYGAVIIRIMRAGGVLTLVALFTLLGSLVWRERQSSRRPSAAERT